MSDALNFLVKARPEAMGHYFKFLKEAGKLPVVRLSEFAESSLNFKLFVWVEDFMSKHRVAHELRKEIYDRFLKEGIQMAPLRTVMIKDQADKD